MNSPTITMERVAAEAKLAEYERAARDNPKAMRELDRGILEGYRLLAKGKRLVDVNAAIGHAGRNLAGQPKLAIARAHVERTRWVPRGRIVIDYRGRRLLDQWGEQTAGLFVYGPTRGHDRTPHVVDDRSLWTLPAGTLVAHGEASRTFDALTPLVPLPHRPRTKLDGYFLLWEANWHPAPPIDPYLLRPLAGSLMEIVAEWDVTPLELAAVRFSMHAGNK